ncbi:MAG: protein kinase domain-containing protein [Thermoanaerobaculia bacterium]
MTLAAGTRLGPYEILAPLGAGGMGEVYRARDTRLGREVAIKVLPAAVASDAERMARFEREARLLASLNHARIATLHGLEESGSLRGLVMELVPGETLAERIAAGPIPPREALPIARQIAEALEYAHEKGIVHRDLKPANVKLTAEGEAKLLDFGLARALDPEGSSADASLSQSPTVTPSATQAGVVLGTAGYMSPEQARGKPADKRVDIWAFGCVLFEMLTGKRAFSGENVTDILASITRDEPEWKELPAGTSTEIRRLLERCLEKDPRRRLQAIGDARLELEEVEAEARSGGAPKSAARAAPRAPAGRVWIGVGAAFVLLAASALLWYRRQTPAGDGKTPDLVEARASAASDRRSLAVLPFANLSGDPENEYFSDGVSEEILNALTRLPGLKVIGRTSSFRFRGRDVDTGEVARQLGVDTILSGSVQRAGDTVRITAELVDARTGYRLWSQRYDRKAENLFALEDEISRSIAEALRIELAGGAGRSLVAEATRDTEAHNLFLRANVLSHRSDEASLEEAIRLYRQAVSRDPSFAGAWAGLANAYFWLGDAYRAPRDLLPLAKEAARKAIALDDSLAAGHLMLGIVALGWDYDLPTARRELERALALDPGAPDAHGYYGWVLLAAADTAGARAQLRKAAELDPLNPYFPYLEVEVVFAQRKLADALEIAERIQKIDPDFFYIADRRAYALAAMGRWEECLRAHEALPAQIRSQPQFLLGVCLAHLGETNRAREIRARLVSEASRRYVDKTTIAAISAALGEKDDAFAWLERAQQDRSARLFVHLPEFEPLRSDPRWAELLSRVRFPLNEKFLRDASGGGRAGD